MKMNKPYFKKVLVFLFFLVFMAGFLESKVFAEDSDVQSFVTRFYQQCLGRNPDAGGLDHWVNSLNNGDKTGADLAQTFVFSEEFEGLSTTDAEFVTVLYRAFFNREPDTSGYENWMNTLSGGASRSAVLDGFTSAPEFATLCQSYGITAKKAGSTDTSVAGFVTRFYQQCLGRNPDAGGLGHWVNSLDAGDKTGEDLAQTFVFSEEFEGLNTSNAEFVTVLYRAFFNREPDTGGYEIWMNNLSNGASRSAVLDGFTSAREFANLCETYGITPVSLDDPVVDPPTPDCINLNGARFTVTEIRNLSSCGVANDVDSFTATVNQTGCSVSILDSDGIWATGTLSGNQLTITSAWYENGGRVNGVYHISISNDGYSFQGTGSGTWTDGYDTCYPTSSISGTQY